MQPSSLGNAVVEHKAQRHFEGLLLPSLFIAMVYSAAHEVPEKTIVPHIQIAHFSVQYGFLVGFSPDRVERHGRGGLSPDDPVMCD